MEEAYVILPRHGKEEGTDTCWIFTPPWQGLKGGR